jgi:hypothetical protein
MRLSDVNTYEELEAYLRQFSSCLGDPVPYDFVGTFHLFLALLDNLAQNHLDADIDGLEETEFKLTPKQTAFLQSLERFRSS